jgi:metallo-beta-lactamase family protein
MRGWHVIIASSGMCDAGRVRHHLKRLLWREDATVLLTGYQAIGTLGRLLQEGRKVVRIQGDEVKVRARVRDIDVYSGHADATGLVAWAKDRAPRGAIFLTHGEPDSLAGLKGRLGKAGFDNERIIITALDQTHRLKRTGRPETEPRPVRVAAAQVARLDWHNQRSDLLTRLNAALERASDDPAREELIKAMQAALDAKLALDQGGSEPGP